MSKYKNRLIGYTTGLLTVENFHSIDKGGGYKWSCRCKCGNTCIVRSDLLTRKKQPKYSCGCENTTHLPNKKSASWKGYEDISGTYWHRVKDGAKSRSIKFEISIQDAWAKFIEQDRKCALTGLELKFQDKPFEKISCAEAANASLDRIDSTKGYIKDNIQWVDKRINQMKWHFPQEEFIKLCKLVAMR